MKSEFMLPFPPSVNGQIVATAARWMEAKGNTARVIIEDLTKGGDLP